MSFKQGTWLTGAGVGLPVQVVHGDVAASNLLADERSGEVTAVLDFDIAGADLRVQDLVVGLKQSGALEAPDWQRRATALVRGYCGAREASAAARSRGNWRTDSGSGAGCGDALRPSRLPARRKAVRRSTWRVHDLATCGAHTDRCRDAKRMEQHDELR